MTDLTEERVRAIVREENLRLLRVLLAVGEYRERGYLAHAVALRLLTDLDTDIVSALPPFRKAIIDYREGR